MPKPHISVANSDGTDAVGRTVAAREVQRRAAESESGRDVDDGEEWARD